jgi:BirA family transcriptional regulator, biotin operon repressor / biotin---[acetyl-CoA-carboxylase] ligase
MDIAHELASHAAQAGTVVLAETQRRGRGRGGKRWQSPAGGGIWMTVLERPENADGLEVLSVRVGLGVARALDPFAAEPVRLKWPNDLLLRTGKLGGILIETRWREERPEWVAIGLGINVRAPGDAAGASLGEAVHRLDVLSAVVPAIRLAASGRGPLSVDEVGDWHSRDVSVGRTVVAPAAGVVRGLAPDGALLVQTAEGDSRCSSGSLIFAEDA